MIRSFIPQSLLRSRVFFRISLMWWTQDNQPRCSGFNWPPLPRELTSSYWEILWQPGPVAHISADQLISIPARKIKSHECLTLSLFWQLHLVLPLLTWCLSFNGIFLLFVPNHFDWNRFGVFLSLVLFTKWLNLWGWILWIRLEYGNDGGRKNETLEGD